MIERVAFSMAAAAAIAGGACAKDYVLAENGGF